MEGEGGVPGGMQVECRIKVSEVGVVGGRVWRRGNEFKVKWRIGKISVLSEKISKTIQIFCFFRVSPLGRSFNSSRFGLKCIRPSPHLALTLALTLTLTLKPPPTPTLTLTLPLTLNKKTA